MSFTFKNRVPLMRLGASMVWHLSLPLMNSFNKTEAAVFPCGLCFLRAFPFLSLILMRVEYELIYVKNDRAILQHRYVVDAVKKL